MCRRAKAEHCDLCYTRKQIKCLIGYLYSEEEFGRDRLKRRRRRGKVETLRQKDRVWTRLWRAQAPKGEKGKAEQARNLL